MKKSKIKSEIAHGSLTIDGDGFTITYRHNLHNRITCYTYFHKYIDSERIRYVHSFVQHENLASVLKTVNLKYAESKRHVSAFDVVELIIYANNYGCDQELFWSWYVNQTDITIAQNAHMSLF